jgi:hypothetical protein
LRTFDTTLQADARAEDNNRLTEIVSEFLFEVQELRMDLKREVGQLRADMNRNHAKATAGLMKVRTSVICWTSN